MADPKTELKKGRYRVRGTDIKHGEPAVSYPEGSEIELTDDEAKPLQRWLAPIEGKGKSSKAAEGEGDQK